MFKAFDSANFQSSTVQARTLGILDVSSHEASCQSIITWTNHFAMHKPEISGHIWKVVKGFPGIYYLFVHTFRLRSGISNGHQAASSHPSELRGTSTDKHMSKMSRKSNPKDEKCPAVSDTLPETNISPENRPLEKEIPIGNHHFRGYVSFRECTPILFLPPLP